MNAAISDLIRNELMATEATLAKVVAAESPLFMVALYPKTGGAAEKVARPFDLMEGEVCAAVIHKGAFIGNPHSDQGSHAFFRKAEATFYNYNVVVVRAAELLTDRIDALRELLGDV